MKLRFLQTLLIAAVLSPGLGVATNLDAPTTNKMSATSTCGAEGKWCDTKHPCCSGLKCEGYGCCLGTGCDTGGGPLLKK